ncbi:MAG: hypothetical protein KF889_11830 [Alphaproteobacteria bacterium]|nr:hypothetical protein [Alphaproteobacteria bacterium]MCW5739321.1 hypothetical protein [Alphaproteobacteria bacterium]
MPKRERLEIRFSQTFHVTLAAVGIMLPAASALWVLANYDRMVGEESSGRLILLGLGAAGLLYYAIRSILRLRETRPQIVIDNKGIWLGFGRDVLLPWADIRLARPRGMRRTLQIGITPELFGRLNLSLFNLDDNLTAVPGGGASVGVRFNGLDRPMRDVYDAIRAWKPGLPLQ